MEVIILLVILYLAFLYIVIRGAMENKKQRQKYRQYLKDLFGKFSDRKMYTEDVENLSRTTINEEEFLVDDITWNDLSMDRIFEQMNFTQSSSGEEYLYKMLRKPVLNNKNDLDKMNRHIEYLMKNEEERIEIMTKLHSLNRSGKYTLKDYMDYLETLGNRNNLKHYVANILIIASFALIFINTSLGVVLLIGTVCYNMATYFGEKGKVAPYVSTFAYIMRLVNQTDEILKLQYSCKSNKEEDSGINDYLNSLKEKRASLKGLETNSKMVLKIGVSNGSMEELLFDYIKMITHIDLIKFNSMFKQVKERSNEIFDLSEKIGYIDAVISIGYYRAALPYYCTPQLSEGNDIAFEIEDGYHPLITSPVPNSFSQSKGMLITGSNASGKSTFLKMVAINSILAQTIYTCAAKKYSANYYRTYSSMALRDDLSNGESYYIVEIKALKRILDAVPNSDTPLLCFVDEVLRGTNTVERIAASAQILKCLAQKNVQCFAATHDIELTHLLEGIYNNYHFEEDVKNGDIIFSYHLMDGRAHTRNAIKLLEIIGFSKDIISSADNMAADFLNSGEWNSKFL
ncbi:MAG: hypothetical protein II193_08740 [Lachnospiraceae bacterium]|nr:hypothetical protein [Lachnospiraceae bacterium]